MEEIEKYLNMYENQIELNHRYASFDFCYNYFSSYKGNLVGENLQTSCMQLWSYLASWGMVVRGNELQSTNYSCLKGVVDYVNKHTEFYDLSIDDDHYADKILKLYNEIKKSLGFTQKNQKTLITKIILGVYACYPAIDINVSTTFGMRITGDLRETDIEKIVDFYKENRTYLAPILKDIKCLSFAGKKTDVPYTFAKLIDMYGFMAGLKKD